MTIPPLHPMIYSRSSIFALVFFLSLFAGEAAQALPAGKAGVNAQTPFSTSQIQKDSLIVGSEQDYPPFAIGMTDTTAGGFTVELWKAVAAEAELNYAIRVRPFRQILQEFKEGKVDVLINLAQSEERQHFADFTIPHVIVHGAIFVRKSETRIHSENDFAGKSIIVLNADLAHDYALSKGWEQQLVLVDNAEQGLRLLAEGKHDAMLLSKLAGMQTLQKRGLSNIKALKTKAGFSQKFAFAVQEGQSDLLGKINEGLALAKSNGTYNALYDKWFGIYEDKKTDPRDLLKYIIATIAVFMGIFAYFIYRRQIEREEAEKKYRDLYDHAPDMFLSVEAKNATIIDCNQTLLEITGYSRDDILSRPVFDLYHPAYVERARATFRQFLETKAVHCVELQLRCLDGGKVDVSLNESAVCDDQGNILHSRSALRDITERKRAETELRIAATAFESQEGMLITDANSVILRINRAFTYITGYSAEEVIGQTPRLLNSGYHDASFYAAMWKSINNEGAWEGEIWNRRKSGEVYPENLTITAVKDPCGIVTNYVATLTDITLRKTAEEKIQYLAYYDPLTELPNRRLLLDRLQSALTAHVRSGKEGALLFLDLDHFKTLNDTLGHDTGDMLLQQVAKRLLGCVRESDTVARLGGDEFVVMLEDLSELTQEAAARTDIIGKKILAALNQPYQLGTHHYNNSSSMGVALFSDHQRSREMLLKHADIAMYQAKKAGRNTLRFFDPQMQATILARVSLEGDLRRAIELRQFQLYYQIQVDSRGQPLGAEALLRWPHPERGMVPLMQFIPLAEETGLILPIGQWVMETACAQLNAWQQHPLTRKLMLSVNVSAKQYRQADFVAQVLDTVQRHAVNPRLLKLELTESMLLDDIEDTIASMNALGKIGIQFSLDDFGTGYSSLQYLKRLPLYQLKIDQSFVRDITVNSSDKAIVRTIIAMAQSLNLNVIAEGVETEEQRQCLLGEGCKHYQGYLFGKPIPMEEFEKLLKTG